LGNGRGGAGHTGERRARLRLLSCLSGAGHATGWVTSSRGVEMHAQMHEC